MNMNAKKIKCSGWVPENGCDKRIYPHQAKAFGKKTLCKKCAKRLDDEEAAWARLTR